MTVLIGGLIGFVLTLLIFSYLLGDNPLYRLAVHVLVGVGAGYAVLVVTRSVLIPWVQNLLLNPDAGVGGMVAGAIPLAIGALLLFKFSPATAPWVNLATAFMVGVGAAVALVGAVGGTLLPIAGSTGSISLLPREGLADWVNGLIILVGTISSLLYFHFLGVKGPDGGVRRPPVLRAVAAIGHGFIVVTLGAIYAGAMLTALAVLTERMAWVYQFISSLLVQR